MGYGDFGRVVLAVHRNLKVERAVKEIEKRKFGNFKNGRLKFIQEVQTLKKMDHPNILKIFEFYEDGDSYHLVSELCNGE